jgi:hypothetical protein
MTTGTSGAYFFMPGPSEHERDEEDIEDSGTVAKLRREEVEVEVLKQRLESMLASSAAKMKKVGAKADRLRVRVRRRPDSVREMRAVLSQPPEAPPQPEEA